MDNFYKPINDYIMSVHNPPQPAGYWSFDGSRSGTWFASHKYPNRFHRWMHKVFFGITWKEVL